MIHRKIGIAITTLLLCTASAGLAQQPASSGKDFISQQSPAPAAEEPWQVAVTPYLWLPLGIDLDMSLPAFHVLGKTFGGDLNTTSSPGNTLGNLFNGKVVAILADGRIEVMKGRWGAFLDAYWIYTRVSDSADASKLVLRDHAQVGGSVSVTNRNDMGQVNFGPRFLIGTVPLSHAADDYSVGFELYGGGRVNWISNKVDGTVELSASALDRSKSRTVDFSSDASRAYIEPMIGLRTTWMLGKNFMAIIRGDVGGFGLVADENWDCDLEAGLAWQFHRNTYLDLGYRARGQWQNDGSSGNITLSGWLHGPEIGVTFKF